ncbi:hypothetical protein [Sodalinema gerasimenkoae]|nr:hypothetical protein [Sodalinema gerasimenkoae]
MGWAIALGKSVMSPASDTCYNRQPLQQPLASLWRESGTNLGEGDRSL